MKKINLLFLMVFVCFLAGFSQTATLPIVEDFEQEVNDPAGGCQSGIQKILVSPNFFNDQTDVTDWMPRRGTTTSSATGPQSGDHTLGTVAGAYLYTEMSGAACYNDTASLNSVYMDWSTFSGVKIDFWYHMFGASLRTLHLDMRQGTDPWVLDIIPSFTDNQDLWQQQAVSVFDPRFTGMDSVQFRIRSLTGSGFGADVAIDDISVNPIVARNLGVLDLISPTFPLCSGTTSNVTATVVNDGTDTITSFTTYRDINGAIDSSVYSGQMFPGDTIFVALGSYTFTGAGPFDIVINTSMPNGMSDQAPGNDTLAIRGVRTGLAGTYTLDGTLPSSATNFVSFNDFENAINDYGVCAATTINVAAGTYNETLEISNVIGLSATNTVTIDGGDSATTEITNALVGVDAVVALSGVSYVTFKNMTVTSTRVNGGNHAGIFVGAGSAFDSIVSVKVNVDPNATFNAYGILASTAPNNTFTSGVNANDITIMNSMVTGGDNNIRFQGNGGRFPPAGAINGFDKNNSIIGCTLVNADDVAVYFSDQEFGQILNNTISDLRTTSTFTGYGIQAFEIVDFVFSGNNIVAPFTAMYVTYANSAKQSAGASEISNNMMSAGINHGLWLTNPNNINIFYNSVQTLSTATVDAAVFLDEVNTTIVMDSLDIRSNIFSAPSTVALNTERPDSIFSKLDNNVYHTTSANLFNIDGTTYADLPSYVAANAAFNGASLEGDPQFLSNADLHIIGAFVDGAGDGSIPITVDIDGDTRPLAGSTMTDPGADEFNPPLCPPPSNLSSYLPALDSITLALDGQGNLYQYQIVPFNSAQGTNVLVDTLTALDSIRLGGLTPSTTYDVYVREACGRGDTSVWIGPISFNTLNGIPFFENFESFTAGIQGNPWPRGWTSNTSVDPNWESEDATGNNENSFGTGPLFDHTQFGNAGGLYMFMETSGGVVGDTADFVSPSILLGPNDNVVELTFWYFNFGPNIDRLDVLIDTNGVETVVSSFVGQQQTAQTDAWRQGRVVLSGYQGNAVNIIFRGVNVNCCSGDIAIDDISLDVLPPNTAGITEIISPQLPICPGTVAPVVGVRNSGTDTLTTVTVVYDVNGTTDSVQFNGSIIPGDTANVTLGNITFANGVLYDLTIYTNFPNMMADGNNGDDTLSLTGLRTGLSGTFTIDSTSAVSATNFQSFEDFGDAISEFGLCGAITADVAVGSGPYINQMEFVDVLGTSSTNTITVNGNGETIEFAASVNTERHVILIENSSWITIDSLNVDAVAGTYGWGVHLTGDANNNTIRNSIIETQFNTTSTFSIPVVASGSSTSSFNTSSVDNLTLDNNTFIGGYAGVSIYGANGSENVGTTITNNNFEDNATYGIYAFEQDSMLFEGNDLYHNLRTTFSFTTYSLGVFGSSTNVTANANEFHDYFAASTSATQRYYGIYFNGDATLGNDNYITNNVMHSINTTGIIYGCYEFGSDYTNYVNNTFAFINPTSTSANTIRAFYQTGASTGSSFLNNIIQIENGGSGALYGIYLQSNTTSINADYNDVRIDSTGTGTKFYGRYGINDQNSLADWQFNTPNGANSYDVDPNFVNVAMDDYTPNQALINAVAFSVPQVTTDFNGVVRGSNPDIGAIEFTPPPVDNVGLNALLAPIESNDSCYGTSQDVIVELLNAGGTVIDFTNSTTTITMNVSGGTTQTLTATVNTNAANGGSPLAIGSSVAINLGTINMMNSGIYDFNGYIDVVNDSLRANDSLISSVTVAAPNGGMVSGSDTICSGDTVSLSASNTTGQLQWQEFVNGAWVDIMGATESSVDVNPSSATDYRVVACSVSPSDTITVTPITVAPPTVFGDTVIVMCGDSGVAIGGILMPDTNLTYKWYDAATGGNEITSASGDTVISANGDSISFMATPAGATSPNTLTAWVTASAAGGSGGPSLVITEADPGGPDALEIQNVSSGGVDVTGWTVAVSNSYTDINNVNLTTQTLSGVMAPGQTMYWTDGTVNAWGSNLFWNPGSPGWILIIDATGNVVDFMPWNWTSADIAGMNITVNSFALTPGTEWIGDGIPSAGVAAGSSMYRQGNIDNNDSTDFIVNTINLGTTNTGMVLPFKGGSCESNRVMVTLRVECTVGLDIISSETATLSVSPNPSNGLFTLKINTPQAENFKMTVRDVNGKVVYNNDLKVNGDYRNDLDFTSFAKGVYYMHIQNGAEAKVEKLIIQ